MSIAFKSLLVSMVTGTTSQLLTILTLYLTDNKILALMVLQVIGSAIAYMGQNFVFMGGRNFFSVLLLKWLVLSTMLLFLSYKLLVYLTEMKKVKELSNTLKGKKKLAFDYSIIVVATLIIYFLLNFPMRKHFIFNEADDGNRNGLLILGVTTALVVYDRFHTNTNKN
jgi:hypothetical protein